MMHRDPQPSRKWALDHTNVAIWGVGDWDSSYHWGAGDPQRQPLNVDPCEGTPYWGRHCWVSDFWVRW